MSEILLWTPGMSRGVIGHAFLVLIRSASTLRSSTAGSNRFDAILSTHDTDRPLLLRSRMCLCFKSPTACSTSSQRKTKPANSRSKLVTLLPLGFCSVCSWDVMLAGHLNRNTVGLHPIFMPNTTPPTPLPDASTIPPTSGSGCRISWWTCVGSLDASLDIVRQSRIAATSAPLFLNHTVRGFLPSTRLNV